jgi:hypothetical protein
VGTIVEPDSTFGAVGHAHIPIGDTTTIAAATLDPTGRYLYVTGNTTSALNDSRGYVARIRLTSTP